MLEQDLKILVIDDDFQMLTAIEKSLSIDDIHADTASNGFEALAKISDESYQVVVTDIRMDGMSGMDLLKQIKERHPDIIVIVMTAYGTIDIAIEAMQNGAADFLVKPFSSEDLIGILNRAIQRNNKHKLSRSSSGKVQIITESSKMKEILNLAKRVANSRASVLIQAESGTGKELLARYIHECSPRSNNPYVAVNCAAVPKELLESELFGHEKGSFTGAITRKIGKFEIAHTGTLVLDEIGEMEHSLQAKILRALQEQEIDRVGGRKPVPIDVRVIATTNQDIPRLIKEDKFREDLYYRINVIPLGLPPLRERQEDIEPLAEYFCKKYSIENNKSKIILNKETLNLLYRYNWPGNVRELENIIHRAVVISNDEEIKPQHLFLNNQVHTSGARVEIRVGVSMKETEKQLIYKTLEETKNNRTHAAKLLGISIRTLRNKLRDYREEEGIIPG
ncbi:MAG: hypothetical protein A2161_08105 [Candidatus Schekmanbacteria bacterium RBG_13_48_7]|uniref:Sigma-54-dependent Fis family transcriptional regulator n=1 Tax=Candidatus Schekmanbacteria bacterium RBG_13_48_7 TaxID=1817878 RepID=A0A1F7RJI1_9BACT|nr:MAG: hypothetical protein A2161_08105 [Candidatus Schekmanbacteria bacterium RBG_13_48_7]